MVVIDFHDASQTYSAACGRDGNVTVLRKTPRRSSASHHNARASQVFRRHRDGNRSLPNVGEALRGTAWF
jgi:hypothetical protein